MAYNCVQARTFLSASEIDLFESSLGASCKTLGTADLHRRIHRARTLRDKSRDLLQRQRLATRARTGSKSGTSGLADERTAKKASALEETLQRFEAEAARREAPSNRPAAKRPTATKPAPVVENIPTKSSGAKPVKAKQAASSPAPTLPRSRPAATVLREALDKKEAGSDSAAAGRTSARSRKAPARSGNESAGGEIQPTSPDARARAVASRLADANLSHTQGHTSTQVRRSQAKRDQKD